MVMKTIEVITKMPEETVQAIFISGVLLSNGEVIQQGKTVGWLKYDSEGNIQHEEGAPIVFKETV